MLFFLGSAYPSQLAWLQALRLHHQPQSQALQLPFSSPQPNSVVLPLLCSAAHPPARKVLTNQQFMFSTISWIPNKRHCKMVWVKYIGRNSNTSNDLDSTNGWCKQCKRAIRRYFKLLEGLSPITALQGSSAILWPQKTQHNTKDNLEKQNSL